MSTHPRVALVTGGAQGIGAGIALRLARDGLDVAVLDVKGKAELLEGVAKQITDLGRRSLILVGDVSDEQAVKKAVDDVVETLGSLDVMIANAAVSSYGPLIQTNYEEYNRVMSINAGGVMLCYKYAALQMIKQARGGRIVGACSGTGVKATPNLFSYCVSKWAIRGMTQAAAQELAPHKITVNAYAPGLIRTPMSAHPDDHLNGGPGSTVQKMYNLPDWQVGDPADIAELVSYVVKPEAQFISGQTLNVDGGINLS